MQKHEDEKIPEESEHCKDKFCCCSPSSRTVCGHKRSKHERSEALRVLFFLTDLVGHSRHCHLEEKADKVLIGALGAYRAQGGYIFLAA